MTPVTVTIPAYGAVADLEACLDSVLTVPAGHDFDVLVIDDATPDSAVAELLGTRSASEPRLAWSRNDSNEGFVATANELFDRTAGDVVLLNADTVVTAGWLGRLHEASRGDGVGTVTPLTNWGSVCTLPTEVITAFGLDGDTPDIEGCARHVLATSLRLRPEVIAGVGFCLYVRREVLDHCGRLDEEGFGPGYGEEIDFCIRAGRLGYRHVVEDSTFVYHRGGASFGDARPEALRRGSAVLHDRYRFFRPSNRAERRDDPLEVPFAALELGLHERDASRRHVLHVLQAPSPYGGTEKHLDSLVSALEPEWDASFLHPVPFGFELTTRWLVGGERVEDRHLFPGTADRVQAVRDPAAAAALEMALAVADVDAVHVHNLIGHGLEPLSVLRGFHGPVVCTVHDLFLACPHHWLLYLNGEACGIPADLGVCRTCLADTLARPVSHLEEFRRTAAELLDVVDHWVFPSRSAQDHLARVYDLDPARVHVVEHGAIIDVDRPRAELDEERILDEPLRLAFVGRGWHKKGMTAANRLAELLEPHGITVHHFGEVRDDPVAALRLHGPFSNQELPELLERERIHIVLLPGPYAETYGQVMTEALVAGLPVMAAGYGALGERIRRSGVGWVIDPGDADGAAEVIANLDVSRREVLRATRVARSERVESVSATAHRYARLYGAAALPDGGGSGD